MSLSTRKRAAKKRGVVAAPIFAALGDETRLNLILKLGDRRAHSITQLGEGSPLTRQAVTKHLRMLERAGLVRCTQIGRECLFELEREPIDAMKLYLDRVSAQWDAALGRLNAFVE